MKINIVLNNKIEKIEQITDKYGAQHSIKLIASASLLTKILTDFLFGFYLLNLLLNQRN